MPRINEVSPASRKARKTVGSRAWEQTRKARRAQNPCDAPAMAGGTYSLIYFTNVPGDGSRSGQFKQPKERSAYVDRMITPKLDSYNNAAAILKQRESQE